MPSLDFDNISARYEKTSLIQTSAADILFGILDIQPHEAVLDLGCGTGKLTRRIREMTDGLVIGVDPSEGMIREARKDGEGTAIEFLQIPAHELIFDQEFDVVFCNSAFQWFSDREKSLDHIKEALKPGGRIGIQAPARRDYCPNFLSALEKVKSDRLTGDIFAGFRPPWYFLDSAEDYRDLFQSRGFTVPFARIQTLESRHSPDEVYTIFSSGAAAGYLNQDYYEKELSDDYIRRFGELLREEFSRQAEADGKVKLVFHRIFLVATVE